MRWTHYLIPTTKEVPKDATAPSHQLMLRAGLIRQLAAGVYSYLPLGYRSLRKIERIVREEMNRAGAVELHMPCLQPIELWEETGRIETMGDVLLRLAGPKGDWRTQTCLGPTHEENVTEIARAYLNSYKQLPINLYQIQTKFRGEARPKSGVLRTREFLMKDAYSFHRDKASLDEGYQKMYEAYCRIYERCGLPYLAVEADSGPIGGDASHEFMVLTDAGEDVVAVSENGDYAANTERATAAALPASNEPMQDLKEVHTPGQRTIDEVTAFLRCKPSQMIKTLIYERRNEEREAKAERRPDIKAIPPMIYVVLVRGDHEVNETKLRRLSNDLMRRDTAHAFQLVAESIRNVNPAEAGNLQMKATQALNPASPPPDRVELARESTISELTGAAVGFAGPHTLGRSGVSYRLIVDQAVTVMRNAASGANKTDFHVTGLNPGRDFPLSGENVTIADVRTVLDGDLSPAGSGSPLRLKKAIEVGHVFKLGTKYSDSMKATFLDNDGKPKPFIMGCYGIGVNRIMAAAIESHHDENGIRWPIAIAPFEVLIVALDPREADVMETAGKLHDALESAGVDVLFDDRDERAGFKFKDADLIGVPIRVTIGRKSLAEGVVELKRRDSAEVRKVAPANIAGEVIALVRQLAGK